MGILIMLKLRIIGILRDGGLKMIENRYFGKLAMYSTLPVFGCEHLPVTISG
jgi:hypothetical protein